MDSHNNLFPPVDIVPLLDQQHYAAPSPHDTQGPREAAKKSRSLQNPN